MSRQDQNKAFLQTSFLDGANAAYLDKLYASWAENPANVSADWQAYFSGLKDQKQDVIREAQGASWQKPHWPSHANGELVSAFDGNWPQIEQQLGKSIKSKAQQSGGSISADEAELAIQDAVRALMLIRAYRVRGHFAADLDPLNLTEKEEHPELMPETYGFGAGDMDRPIFLDQVLGLETATMRQIMEVLKRIYRSHIGVEFMHIADPEKKAWVQARIENDDKWVEFTPEGKKINSL